MNPDAKIGPDGWDIRKCPAHNFWKRKGQCEICLLEAEARRREYEKAGGSHKPPVRVGTSDKIGGKHD